MYCMVKCVCVCVCVCVRFIPKDRGFMTKATALKLVKTNVCFVPRFLENTSRNMSAIVHYPCKFNVYLIGCSVSVAQLVETLYRD